MLAKKEDQSSKSLRNHRKAKIPDKTIDKPAITLTELTKLRPNICKGVAKYIKPGYRKFATGYPYPKFKRERNLTGNCPSRKA